MGEEWNGIAASVGFNGYRAGLGRLSEKRPDPVESGGGRLAGKRKKADPVTGSAFWKGLAVR
jgi:hypothetical protein